MPTDDRAVLVALYEATDGPNWKNKKNWLSDRPLGEWHGVTTDANGRMTGLSLSNNNLRGPIPVELAQLSNLQSLSLINNQLTGTIPKELAQLTKLTDLDLGPNLLTGTIPTEQGQLTNLQVLILAYNQLTGAIPKELAQLTNLAQLALKGNPDLSGPLPPAFTDLSLEVLDLAGTGVCVPLTVEFAEWLDSIPAKWGGTHSDSS